MSTLTANITNVLVTEDTGVNIFVVKLQHPKAETVPTDTSIQAGVACQRYGVFMIPTTALSESVILKAKLDGVIYSTDTDQFSGTCAGDLITFSSEEE